MSLTLVHYESENGPAWAVVSHGEALPLPGDFPTTAAVLSDGAKLARDLLADPTGVTPLPLASLQVLNPITRPCRVVAQGANFRTHLLENKMDPNRSFNVFFTKSTASLSGPNDDIVRPSNVKLLDYEVELGIVLGKAITGPVTITPENLPDYVGAFVVANDVSARDIQLPENQWYKGKSYRTFLPTGPYLVVPDASEVALWSRLRLRLEVNGEVRQNELASDMLFGPAETLTELSLIEDLDPGDLLITGTPSGVALELPSARAQRVAGLLPEDVRWKLFIKSQLKAPGYLKPGDLVTTSIRTDDGALDLGTQRNAVTAG
ncbi:MAG: fumarylacetoacetate hydrolase family protein [Marmoricola sp.]